MPLFSRKLSICNIHFPLLCKFLEDDIKETNNNGLEYTVAVLENLYTDPDFPPKAQKLEASLKSTGKSRHNNKYPSTYIYR